MICFQAYKKSPGFNFSFLLVKKCPRRNGSQASLLPTIRAKIISKNHHVVHFRGLLHDIPLTKKHLMNHQLRDTLKLPTGKKKKNTLWHYGKWVGLTIQPGGRSSSTSAPDQNVMHIHLRAVFSSTQRNGFEVNRPFFGVAIIGTSYLHVVDFFWMLCIVQCFRFHLAQFLDHLCRY